MTAIVDQVILRFGIKKAEGLSFNIKKKTGEDNELLKDSSSIKEGASDSI